MTLPHAVAASSVDAKIRSSWIVALAGIAVGLAAIGIVFRDSVAAAVSVWINSATYNHCFLILPISLYLIWKKREALREMEPRPFWPALLLAVPFGGFWLLGYFASVLEAQQIAVVSILQMLLLTVLGWRIYRTLLFPFLYLYFMVPSGEFLVPTLQDFTAAFVVQSLQLFNIPVYSDGYLISTPTGDFEVAEACAGLRFLIASIAFGFLFAHVMYRSWPRRVVFVVLSAIVPIFANGVRATGIVLLAYATNNELAVGVDHLVYGWFFFTLVLLALIWIGAKFREDGRAEPTMARERQPGAPAPVVGLASVAAVAAVLAAPVAAAVLEARPVPADPSRLALPASVGPFAASGPGSLADWRPEVPGADARLTAHYAEEGQPVALHVAFLDRQRHREKLISNDVLMADMETWSRFWQGGLTVTGAELPDRVACERFFSGIRERLVCRWYWVNGTFTSGTLDAKKQQVMAELLGGNRSAALIAVATDVRGRPEDAFAALTAFLSALPPLAPALDAASGATN